jgi:GlpG protein
MTIMAACILVFILMSVVGDQAVMIWLAGRTMIR